MDLETPFASLATDDKSEITWENDATSQFLKTTGVIAGGVMLGQSMVSPNNAEAALSAPTITGVSYASGAITLSVSGAITFTWSAVTGATGYKLYYGISSGNYTVGSTDLGNVTTKSFTGLPAGTYYVAFTAYATNTSALGGVEESVKSTELIVTMGVPVPPAASSAVIGSTIYLVWGAVTGASGYKVYYGTSSRNYSAGAADLGNVTIQAFTSVPSGTYYAALSTYNTSGEGGLSREMVIVVP